MFRDYHSDGVSSDYGYTKHFIWHFVQLLSEYLVLAITTYYFVEQEYLSIVSLLMLA